MDSERGEKGVTPITKPVAPRRALGRGLDALLPVSPPPAPHASVAAPGSAGSASATAAAPASDGVRQIELSRINPNPHQPRQSFHAERLNELAESIKRHGIVQPIVVKPIGDHYLLIAGERRWRAAALAGLSVVPAIIRDVPDRQILEITLIENIQREDLNPIETAEAFARLASEAALTHEQIAERTGKERASVSNFLRLLKLPDEVRRRIALGELSMGHARALLALTTELAQRELATRIVDEGLSVRQAENIATGMVPGPKKLARKPETAAAPQDPNVQAAVLELERALGTRVRIDGDTKHGKIIIQYHSSQDLDRIYDTIVGQS